MFRYAKDVRLASVTPTLTPSVYLISSQGPCSALSAAATLTHFFPVWLKISQILLEYTTDVVQYAPAVHCTKFVLMRKTMEVGWSTVGFGRDSMWKLWKMRFKEAAYLAYLGSAQQIYKKFTAFRVWNHENCVQWRSLKIQHTWTIRSLEDTEFDQLFSLFFFLETTFHIA